MDEVLDINGWDLRKTLKHFHRGNATLFEWGNSPVVYKTTDTWSRIHDAASPCFSVKAAIHHYCGTAGNTFSQFLQEDLVRYKKYFYALRPLLAGRYILEHRCPPPVLFDDLMKMEMPVDLRAGIEELLEIKKKSGESQRGKRIPVESVRTEYRSEERRVGKECTG